MQILDQLSTIDFVMKFQAKLPGHFAWQKLMPFKHPLSTEYSSEGLKPAAVLIALYRHDNRWMLPLIQRTEDGHQHSGQVSFPGGRADLGEDLEHCALREAYEEIGIDPQNITVIGKLTPIPIHVSHHLVHPFVAIVNQRPEWILQTNEVSAVLEIGLNEFNDQAIQTEEWDFPHRGGLCPVPFYYLREKKIWGATAMILSELMAVLNN